MSNQNEKNNNELKSAQGFDPTGLQKALDAVKELKKSGYEQDVVKIALESEKTKQEESHERQKRIEAESKMLVEQERRKTLEKEYQLSKDKSDQTDRLERKRQEDLIAAQRKMHEEKLRHEEDSIQRQEKMRRETINYEAKLRLEQEQARIEAQRKADAKNERETNDLVKDRLQLKERERRTTVKELLTQNTAFLRNSIGEFFSSPQSMGTFIAFSAAMQLTFQFGKQSALLFKWQQMMKLQKPPLVRDTSINMNLVSRLRELVSAPKQVDLQSNVIVEQELKQKLNVISSAILNRKNNNSFQRNILIHGPPGTGKTLWAKSLALQSGMDQAIMTGGDVAPLGQDAVTELHKLFDWASLNSKRVGSKNKGMIIFVDEADAFLRKRQSFEHISESMRNALNVFLQKTGTQSKDFMLVLASNAPEQLDRAVYDRCDEIIEFGLPKLAERVEIILKYLEDVLKAKDPKNTKELIISEEVDDELIQELGEKTDGFSGRELFKLVNSFNDYAMSKEDCVLDRATIQEAQESQLVSKNVKKIWNDNTDQSFKL